MIIEIPTWVLYVLYILGGVLALGVLFVICSFAFVGWMFVKHFKPPSW